VVRIHAGEPSDLFSKDYKHTSKPHPLSTADLAAETRSFVLVYRCTAEGHPSKSADEFLVPPLDSMATVGNSAKEACPVFLARLRQSLSCAFSTSCCFRLRPT
jgi:hypothetical protein